MRPKLGDNDNDNSNEINSGVELINQSDQNDININTEGDEKSDLDDEQENQNGQMQLMDNPNELDRMDPNNNQERENGINRRQVIDEDINDPNNAEMNDLRGMQQTI